MQEGPVTSDGAVLPHKTDTNAAPCNASALETPQLIAQSNVADSPDITAT